jgi:uncharacterized tellurite resistance protein B-like protein
MADVFISYKSKDRDKAAALAKALKRESVSVWWDTHLAAGDDWLRKLVKEVDAAKCLIGLWTRNSVDEDGFFRESDSMGHNFIRIEHQRAGTKKVIGALLDRSALPLLYADRQCAVLADWSPDDHQHPEFRKLVDAIRARIGALAADHKAVISRFETVTVDQYGPFVSKLPSSLAAERLEGWSVAEACMHLLVAAALETDMDERRETWSVRNVTARSRSLNALGPADLAQIDHRMWDRMRNNSAALAEACQALPVEMRLPLFGQCVEIVLTEGLLDASQADFLNRLASLLRLDREAAHRMVEALVIKNQF